MSRPASKKQWDEAHRDKMREYKAQYERRHYDQRRRANRERMRVKGQRLSLQEFWAQYRAQRAAGGPGYEVWVKQYSTAKHGGWG